MVHGQTATKKLEDLQNLLKKDFFNIQLLNNSIQTEYLHFFSLLGPYIPPKTYF